MKPSFTAFSDELVKISADRRVSKEKVIRAVKAGLTGAAGAGLGAATGHLISRALDPKIIELSSGKRKALVIGAGLLGGAIGLGQRKLRRQFTDYVSGGP